MVEDQLPDAIEFYLISLGFHKKEYAPNYKAHGDIHIPDKDITKYVAWKPSFAGEEPPF